jgi:HD-like signal output (HDOD) protein
MLVVIVLAASLLGIGAWLVLRRRPVRARSPDTSPSAVLALAGEAKEGAPAPAHDTARLELANREVSERLWKLAFAAPSQVVVPEPIRQKMRDNILAMLEVDTLDPKYFPRRPTLMPQLMQAVNDPTAAADRISRIIAHDPVLTADVLRLANSGMHRTSATPIDSIHRAIVVCGVEALRGMLAAAMLRPVFRATSKNFPRFPRVLWDRTERAVRAAELYVMETGRPERFEAQLAVLLNALGPLVVYSAALDVFTRNPHFPPSAPLCVDLVVALSPRMSLRIARDWQTSPRLLAALEFSPQESLTAALRVGELMGTLSFLESQTIISRDERLEYIAAAELPAESSDKIWAGMPGNA